MNDLARTAQMTRVLSASVGEATRRYAAPLDEVRSDRRGGIAMADARTLHVWALRTFVPGISYPEIGRILDMHHTTAIHHHRRAILRRLEDAAFAEACAELIRRLPFAPITSSMEH